MNKYMSTQETRVDDTAVRGSVRRFALPLIGGILALSLAACETRSNSAGSSLFGSDEQTAAAPQGQNAQTASAKPISFAPIIGAPAKISSQMSEELAAAASAKGLKIESSGDSGYTVRGYLVAASAQTGTKLSYIWDIRDQNGQRAERFQGDELIEGKKGGDPWALVDDVAIKRIAASTADKISTWMYGAANTPSPQPEANIASAQPPQQASTAAYAQTAPQQPAPQEPAPQQVAARDPAPQQASVNVATAEPVSAGEIVAVVQPVTGAPGDGEQSLTSAMRKHLASAGVKLTEQASGSVYTVRGTVELGAADGGQQPITIRWLVVDPNGAQIDKAVVQRNRIPAGSLDGQWGQVADLAASEAAKSVAKLIRPTG